MRSLSLWAKHHYVQARILIVLSHVILFFVALFIAFRLSAMGILFSPLWIYFFIAVFLATAATYPPSRSVQNFVARKWRDFVIAASGFILVILTVTALDKPFSTSSSLYAATELPGKGFRYAKAEKLIRAYQAGEKKHFTLREKMIISKEFKYQLWRFGQAKITGRQSEAGDAALIIVACVVAVGLLFLLAALACNISCNGQDALAVIVGVAGTAAIIWGLVAVIRAIKRKKKKRAAQPSE